jgi:uncharacterized protein YegL
MGKKKTIPELIASYKKANKKRREIIANNAGFSSGDLYLKHLEDQVEAQPNKTPNIHIIHVLDLSGSMRDKYEHAIRSINKEYEEFNQDTEANYFFSLIPFDSEVKVITNDQSNPGPIPSRSLWYQFGGLTSLNDAIIKSESLSERISERNPEDDRILVKIFTDGGENSSDNTFTIAQRAIKEMQRKGITVTFVGTPTDVDISVRKYSIDRSNTLVHDNTVQGVMDAFAFSVSSTRGYSSKVKAGLSKEETLTGFYKQEGEL